MTSELEKKINKYFRFNLHFIKEDPLQPRHSNGKIITDPEELVIYALQNVISGLNTRNIMQFMDWYRTELNKDYNDIEGWHTCKNIHCFAIKTEFGQVICDTSRFDHVNIIIDIHNLEY